MGMCLESFNENKRNCAPFRSVAWAFFPSVCVYKDAREKKNSRMQRQKKMEYEQEALNLIARRHRHGKRTNDGTFLFHIFLLLLFPFLFLRLLFFFFFLQIYRFNNSSNALRCKWVRWFLIVAASKSLANSDCVLSPFVFVEKVNL